jgi:hypothetical protein
MKEQRNFQCNYSNCNATITVEVEEGNVGELEEAIYNRGWEIATPGEVYCTFTHLISEE